LTYHTTARADARALAFGLAIGAAVGLVLGGAYVAGGLSQAADIKSRAERVARAALAPANELIVGQTPAAASPAPGRPLALTRISSTAAQPFRRAETPVLSTTLDVDCLADAVYYEARGETLAGQAAIAQVVLNRVRHPAFPKSVCGVVFQGANTSDNCQFSFACNGAMRRPKDAAAWVRSEQIAARALSGFVMPQVGEATHFHAAGVRPGWGPNLLRVAQVGLHVFYRFGGHAGAPSMFGGDVKPSATGSDAPHAVYASMLPGLGGEARPSASYAASVTPATASGVAKLAVTAPTPAPTVDAADKPKSDDAPSAAKPATTVS
jgi:spore germination cell wall hydrolase CwlJ-like protein